MIMRDRSKAMATSTRYEIVRYEHMDVGNVEFTFHLKVIDTSAIYSNLTRLAAH